MKKKGTHLGRAECVQTVTFSKTVVSMATPVNKVREPILLLLISALAVLALPSSDLYSHYLLLLKELFMFETMKRKQSNSNVFNLLVDGCYFIVSGAQWPVCTLYISIYIISLVYHFGNYLVT